jgi:DNA-binding CsgD family transcriptional regulator
MSKRPPMDDLLLALVEGAFESPPWSSFLDRLRQQARADYASLIFRPPGLPTNTVLHLYSGRRSPPHVQRLYQESFYRRDPTPYHTMREAQVYRLDDLLQRSDPAREAYVRDVMVPSGMNALRMMRIVEAGGVSAWLTVTRTTGDFRTADEVLLHSLAPHLKAVLRSFIALEVERTRALLAGEAIQRLDYGWIALAADSSVLEADVQGRMILERSGVLRQDPQGRLTAASRQAARRIVAAIRTLAAEPNARPRAMVLCRDPWLDMLLVPANRAVTSAKSVPAVIAYVHGDSVLAADRCEQLAQLFDLLPSESRLALALSRGMSIAEAAAELGLTVETARTYSKSIYAKMGARGQSDLVRFVHRSVLAIS